MTTDTDFMARAILCEIFLTRQKFLKKQDTGCLEEVRFPQGDYTLLNDLQNFTHAQCLGLFQGKSIKNTAHTERARKRHLITAHHGNATILAYIYSKVQNFPTKTSFMGQYLLSLITMSFIKLRMCLRIGKRSFTGGTMRGSSIDRKERSLRRPRLKGALRGKTSGDVGSPI